MTASRSTPSDPTADPWPPRRSGAEHRQRAAALPRHYHLHLAVQIRADHCRGPRDAWAIAHVETLQQRWRAGAIEAPCGHPRAAARGGIDHHLPPSRGQFQIGNPAEEGSGDPRDPVFRVQFSCTTAHPCQDLSLLGDTTPGRPQSGTGCGGISEFGRDVSHSLRSRPNKPFACERLRRGRGGDMPLETLARVIDNRASGGGHCGPDVPALARDRCLCFTRRDRPRQGRGPGLRYRAGKCDGETPP